MAFAAFTVFDVMTVMSVITHSSACMYKANKGAVIVVSGIVLMKVVCKFFVSAKAIKM